MQTLIKYISQFLLIPLLKELASYLLAKYQAHQEAKKLAKANQQKVEEYGQATTTNDARDAFRKLP